MREIELTKGYVALVDDWDYARVSQYRWCASEKFDANGKLWNVYAIRGFRVGGKHKSQLMHRFILGLEDPKVQVDHAPDSHGLNNQRINLRTTRTQNQSNAQLSKANSSGFKGVCWDKCKEKWWAQIRGDGKARFLGYHTNAEDAARAYDVAAVKFFGEFANTNVMLGLLEAL